jgi:hypothetical protein
VSQVGDFNGDGKADILWRNVNAGDVTVWDSNSTPFSFTTTDLGPVSSDWQIKAA